VVGKYKKGSSGKIYQKKVKQILLRQLSEDEDSSI